MEELVLQGAEGFDRAAGALLYDSARHGALHVQLGQRGGAAAERAQARFWREK